MKCKSNNEGECKEQRIEYKYVKNYDQYNFFDHNDKNRYTKLAYLNLCESIISQNLGKNILILSRTNKLLGSELKEFENILKARCMQLFKEHKFNDFVKVKTVHKSKGEESDIVIVLNVTKDCFPLPSKDYSFFEIFGDDVDSQQEDEDKLFYVAITRAKEKLYILYDYTNRSSYIDGL